MHPISLHNFLSFDFAFVYLLQIERLGFGNEMEMKNETKRFTNIAVIRFGRHTLGDDATRLLRFFEREFDLLQREMSDRRRLPARLDMRRGERHVYLLRRPMRSG